MHRPEAAAPAHLVLAVGIVLGGFSIGLAGCDQLSARSMVQEGNALYDDQEYEKAIVKYEAALQKAPGLGVIRHNLGLSYARLYRVAVDTPENKALEEKATEQLSLWLDKHPNDTQVRKFLLNLWIQAEDYQRAIDYFMAQHDKDPNNREFVQKIAGIHLMAQDWRTAVEWYYKDAALAPDTAAKVAVFQGIANVAYGKLWTQKGRQEIRGVDRTEIAEVGIQAAGEGLALDDKHIALTSTSQRLWEYRAIAQGPFWAAAIDRAEAQIFEQRVHVLREEAKKNQPPPPAGGPPATGSGS